MLEMSHILVSESHDSFGDHLPGRKSRLVEFGVTVHLLRVGGMPLGFFRAGDSGEALGLQCTVTTLTSTSPSS